MEYSKSKKYQWSFIQQNIMGPNPMKALEELLEKHPLLPDETILDLGCGHGVTSIFAAKEYDSRVFAADLWVSPTQNKKLFDKMGISSRQIIPVKAEAHALPFADEFFDSVISVDAYHYFGLDPEYLNKHLLPLVKHGGYIFIAVPGLKKDIHEKIPQEMLVSWDMADIQTWHDLPYWRCILESSSGIEIVELYEMDCFKECWNDWLLCDNVYACNDRKSIEAGAGKYMNFIAIILRRK